jgi:NAD(P)-dependent dehydrogenase (short-subunit alcohol dehydrogenase family)
MLRFQQKVVIVTGAASGIGAATARRISSEGGCVALVDRSEVDLANVAVDLPKELTLAHIADVSDSKAVDAMVEAVVKRFGRLGCPGQQCRNLRRRRPHRNHQRPVAQGDEHRRRWRVLRLSGGVAALGEDQRGDH